jgi:sporulation protein YlmC with PRC-barrel domain
MKKTVSFACMSLLVGSLAVAQTTQTPTMPHSSTPAATSAAMTSTDEFRASKLIGVNVKNNDGETIGEVDDLIMSSGDKMLQAILSVGGFLGIGERHVAVPFKDIKVTRVNNDNELFYQATKDQLEGMPKFSYDETEKMAQMVRASKLIGMNVKNGTDETIGEVEDLIVSAADGMPKAVLDVGNYLDSGEKLVSVPYDSLKMSGTEDKEIIYTTTKEELSSMPAFTYNH